MTVVENENWITLIPLNFEVGHRFILKLQWSCFKIGEVIKIAKVIKIGETVAFTFENEEKTKSDVMTVFERHEMKAMFKYLGK